MSTIELALAVLAVLGALTGGAWAMIKIVATQFEARLSERFTAIDRAREEGRKQWQEHFRQLETAQRVCDKTLMDLLIALPKEYVRREDHIRFETVINAKLDAMNTRFDLVAERLKKD